MAAEAKEEGEMDEVGREIAGYAAAEGRALREFPVGARVEVTINGETWAPGTVETIGMFGDIKVRYDVPYHAPGWGMLDYTIAQAGASGRGDMAGIRTPATEKG